MEDLGDDERTVKRRVAVHGLWGSGGGREGGQGERVSKGSDMGGWVEETWVPDWGGSRARQGEKSHDMTSLFGEQVPHQVVGHTKTLVTPSFPPPPVPVSPLTLATLLIWLSTADCIQNHDRE